MPRPVPTTSRSRPRRLTRLVSFGLTLLLASTGVAWAQLAPLPHERGASGLGLALRRLERVGSVLYVTAHPDDENNGVLVMLGRGRGLRTGLLTLTRGSGGQNEIGPELFEALGVLRSEELMAIHRYDGAEQFFTRAYEFGYSFSVEETFEKWGREEILRDVVRVVRAFRPDVILTLPLEGEGGGQHHQAAGRLAHEAFRAAADPARFPEQLAEGLRPWQASKIYQGGLGLAPGDPEAEGAVVLDTSPFDPLLGESWHQMGSRARALHRCQGASQILADPGRGSGAYRLLDAVGPVRATGGMETDVFDGIDTTWRGLLRFAPGHELEAVFLEPGLRAIAGAVREALDAWSPARPEATLPALREGLVAVRRLHGQLGASTLDEGARFELRHRLDHAERQFVAALALAHGLELRALASDGEVVPGQTFDLTVDAFNAGAEDVRVEDLHVEVPQGWEARLVEGRLASIPARGSLRLRFAITVASVASPTQPYWRRRPDVDRYAFEPESLATLPWAPPHVSAVLDYASGHVSARLTNPAHWRYEGPWVGGEKQKTLQVLPGLSVHLRPSLGILPLKAGASRTFEISVRNNTPGPADGTLRLEVTPPLVVDPAEAPLTLAFEGEEATLRVSVSAPEDLIAGAYELRAFAELGGETFASGDVVVAYDHVHERRLYQPSVARLEAFDVRLPADARIGYVEGVGDDVFEALDQLGLDVAPLTDDDLAHGDLGAYTTIVTGVRAYKVRDALKQNHSRVMQWVSGGGHLVVMYNKFEFNVLSEAASAGGFSFTAIRDALSPFAPYPASVTRDRVTVEEAPVEILEPRHALLRTPNRIGAEDFAGWVQERGLYFFGAKDPHYVELLASEDPWPYNAGRKVGLLTTAPVGKGSWTYVGLGLFRQLPAGVPGAYRILANLVGQ